MEIYESDGCPTSWRASRRGSSRASCRSIEHLNISPELLGPSLLRLVDGGDHEARGRVVTPRVVVVTRKTDFDMLLVEHATFEQARFFLKTRGQDIAKSSGRGTSASWLRSLG